MREKRHQNTPKRVVWQKTKKKKKEKDRTEKQKQHRYKKKNNFGRRMMSVGW